ncbi:hypothetical protein C7A17_24385 [Ectopseudomonas mendocina]|uniref:Uncharacterized protein n=1 Tax=Ectopseudomonas mendocina TaxID=300 RepID=A0A2R3QVH2_ECTME|nr:hypothetical protein C7A17_24385 [Pseudomonas mendocina]
MGENSLTVDRYWSRNEWGEENELVIDICILNKDGQQVDRYYCTDDEINEFRILESLHSAAHRRYYKIDEIIDDLIVNLDRIGE